MTALGEPRGDLLLWHGALIHGGTPMGNSAITRRSRVRHSTTVASHKRAQAFQVAEGFRFASPPSRCSNAPCPAIGRRGG